jgi:septal ring factor EnvC (AmiA/AmiB activator)
MSDLARSEYRSRYHQTVLGKLRHQLHDARSKLKRMRDPIAARKARIAQLEQMVRDEEARLRGY